MSRLEEGAVEVERFWIIRPLKAGERWGGLLGKLIPSRGFKLWGAQFTLLCDKEQQRNMDILAAVSPENPACERQDDIKKPPIYFYAQRDAYALCSGIRDVIHAVILPEPIRATRTVYVKGFCGNYADTHIEPSRFDIIVDLFLSGDYEVEDTVPKEFSQGGF